MPRQPHHSSNYSRDLVKRADEEGIHPFDLLIGVVRNVNANMKGRMYCAGTLLPYCAQRLQQTKIKVSSELDGLTLAEKVALAASMRDSILEARPETTLPRLGLVNDVVGGEFSDCG